MSLINKMLQDLETRKTSPAEDTQKKNPYEGLKPVSQFSRRGASSRRLVMLLALVVLAGGGAYGWLQWGDTLMALVLPQEPAVKTAAVAPRQAPAPKSQPPAAPAPAAAPTPAAAAPPVTPTPVVASATVSAPAPATVSAAPAPAAAPTPAAAAPAAPSTPQSSSKKSTPPAKAEKVSMSASSKVVEAKSAGTWTVSRGETLYGISVLTGIDLWDLSNWNGLGRNHVIHVGQKLRLTPPASAAKQAGPATKPLAKPDASPKERKEVAAVRLAEPEKPEAKLGPALKPAAEGVMDKQAKPFSANEKAESEYRRAVELLQKGRTTDSEKHLKLALKADAAHAAARELLAGLMLQHGHWREAAVLLEQGIDTVPSHAPFALLLARVHVEHGADNKALAVLEENQRAGAENPEYLAFLAALYQRVGKHPEAIKAYTSALVLSPQEGRWWLGIGISFEAAQDWKAAREAFQRAINTGVLEDKLSTYARSRLAAIRNR